MSASDQYGEPNFSASFWSPLISNLANMTDVVIGHRRGEKVHYLIFNVLYTRKSTKGY